MATFQITSLLIGLGNLFRAKHLVLLKKLLSMLMRSSKTVYKISRILDVNYNAYIQSIALT